MSRRRKRRKIPGAGKHRGAGSASPIAPPVAAGALLQAGRYREAITAFKARLEGEDAVSARQGLANAYEGRARELARKGMLREATAIWEQRAEGCSTPLVVPEYLAWLVGSGRGKRAAGLAREHAERLEASEGGRAVAALLGAAALSGTPELLEELPGDHPVVTDFAVADAALRAYCRGDDEQLERALGGIAYRSPYRELCTLLKACQRIESNHIEAAALARRLGPDSPYRGLARVVEIAGRPRLELVEALDGIDTNSRNIALNLLGLDHSQAAFLKEAARLGAAPSPKALFELIIRHLRVLGIETARELAGRLLAHYPPGVKMFGKTFSPPSQLERSRWAALAAELEGDPYETDEAWRQAIALLGDDVDDEDNRLRAACILRRIGEIWSRNGEAIHTFLAGDLEMIVTLDAADRESWLKLIETTRAAGDLKASRHHLDEAMRRFPDDTHVLLAAVETALAGNAYKKAARFATRLVEVDPLDPRAKRLLLSAHLDHARKQIRGGSLAGAARELDLAARWAGAEREEGEVALLRGMVALAQGAPETAGPQLRRAEAGLGGGLTGRFFLSLEAFRLRQDAGSVLAAAELHEPAGAPAAAEVVQLMRAIQGLGPDEQSAVQAVLGAMAGPLERATGARYSEGELELVCETLKRHGAYELLERYARAALRVWEERPVFVYYLVYAKGRGAIYGLGSGDCERAERALEQARQGGDPRTAHRISELLASGYFPLPARVPMVRPGDLEELKETFDALGPDAVLRMLDAVLEELVEPDDIPADGRPRGRRRGARGRGRSRPSTRQGDLFE